MMLWAYSIAIVVVLVLISLYLSKLVTRPLSQFVHLIERYGQGENVNFDATGNLPKEIRELKNVLQLSIEKREEAEAQLSHQANHDALTDLPNRYLSVDRLNQLIREARRNRSVVAVMFIDLDDFKKFNDSLGHGIGDKILASIADRLRTSVREEDTIGRLGGDEFIGVFGNLNSIIDAQPLAETITSAFQHPFDVDGRQLRLSASIGIAFYPDDGDNSGEILKKADTAMYHSKVSGKNIYTFHSENMYKAVKRRLELEENLLFALENNEFEVVFQPKYASSPIQLEGFEALLRWNSSQLGTVSPEEFIPVAEQSGAIIEIGKCVIKESLDFIKQVNRMFGETYSVAVNLSPAQFREDTLIDQIKTLLHQYDLPAELLEVEITENLLLQENEAIFNTLEKLGAMAVKIAMDDFGKGYSSLNYLRRFHFDVIKIDKDFVRGMATSKSDQELVTATILMAHALDLKVVAEGVETKEQLEFLVDHQCDALQGYYLSKPMARTALAEQLKSDKEKVNLRLVT
jgi:diguanylate cyclase (GGDEF)-like protein